MKLFKILLLVSAFSSVGLLADDDRDGCNITNVCASCWSNDAKGRCFNNTASRTGWYCSPNAGEGKYDNGYENCKISMFPKGLNLNKLDSCRNDHGPRVNSCDASSLIS